MTPRAKKAGAARPANDVIVGPPEAVRINPDTRDLFITLKRRTGVMNWNVLSRWALCRSLAEPSAPTAAANAQAGGEVGVEMTWKVFAGSAGDIYWWLLKQRAKELGLPLDEPTLAGQLRAHITRGAQYLVGDANMKDVTDLAGLVTSEGGSEC